MNKDDFFQSALRPLLGYCYIVICLFDFVLGPILFNVLEFLNTNNAISAYTSVTLQNGGILHLSFGSIIGISSHGRTKEKIAEKTMS
jgi:hypothetical protein